MTINVVIPMAGEGRRFKNGGYRKPKPFIDVLNEPMIVRVLENLSFPSARYFLIAKKDHLEKEKELVRKIKKRFNVVFCSIDHTTEGPACTVLYVHKYINNENPLVIANSDQLVDINFFDYVDDCLSRNLDGSIMIFKDPEKNPKWSFAKVDSRGMVNEVREKIPISDSATVGIYMFSKGRTFVESAIDMIVSKDRVNNEFYVCPVYNYAVKDKKKIGIYDIPFEAMHGLGTPEDLKNYVNHFREV